MTGLAWKLSRLRAMGGKEIAYRLRHAAQAQWERRGLGLARPHTACGNHGRPWLTVLPTSFDVTMYREEADRVLAGRLDVFAMKDAELGFPPEWNRDPKTGKVAPLIFGKSLNYRDERIVGDIKYLWEPNRHAELVTLAQAWHLTQESKYVDGCRTLLESWFDQCPYPYGVNWTSSLEHAVRLVNWSFAWQLLGGESSPLFILGNGRPFSRRWQDGIYQHLHFIAGHFSRHSSANNHLLGELMGLFVGSVTWPVWPEAAKWQRQAKDEFEQEALKQTAADGVNREQAIWYHHEVADMMFLCGLVGRANGIEFSDAYWQRLESMLEFIGALMDAGGHMPMIGDADDAQMVRLCRMADFNVFRSLLATGSILFKRPDFALKAGKVDEKTQWLLGDNALAKFNLLARQAGAVRWPRAFPHGGYYVLGVDLETPSEIRLVADAAPLGYLSIAAHGHADALAITLSVAGQEILIDPGTYTYNTQHEWREYFKGTSAHNTVRVDGLDQSVSGGNFLWVRHAHASCERWECGSEKDVFVGSHDGYLRLKDPVRHRRTMILHKASRRVQIVDRLECAERHGVEVLFHVGEDCRVEHGNSCVLIECGPVKVRLRNTHPKLMTSIVKGQESPPLGWVSRRFDEKRPSHTIVWSGDIFGTTELVTEIQIENSPSIF